MFSLFERALARISSGYRNRKVCHNQSSHQRCSFFPDFLWRQNPRRVESRKIWILERPCPSFLAVNLHYVNNCSIFSAFLTWSSTTCKLTAVFSWPCLKKEINRKESVSLIAGYLPCICPICYNASLLCYCFLVLNSLYLHRFCTGPHIAPCCTPLNILLHSGMSLLCLRPVGNGKYWNLNKEIKFQLGVDLKFYSKLCLISHNLHTLWYYWTAEVFNTNKCIKYRLSRHSFFIYEKSGWYIQ